jgi:hypothetical protein
MVMEVKIKDLSFGLIIRGNGDLSVVELTRIELATS